MSTESPQQVIYTAPVQDKGVLIERTQFSEELKNFRVALTGKFWNGREWIVISQEPLLCEKHFNKLIPKLFLANTKATTLSKVSRITVEKFIVHSMNNQEAWFIRNCYTCKDCGIKGDYNNIDELMDAIEPFFYFNFSRAVEGFEAEKIANAHTSQEQVVRTEEAKTGGFLSLRRMGGNRQ